MKNLKKNIVCFIVAVFFISSSYINLFNRTILADDSVNSPWINSDALDYVPGALVNLNGGNWKGDEEVKISIEGISEKKWSIEKRVEVTTEGAIVFQFNLPKEYIKNYKVTATGVTTGHVATTTFSDSAGSYSLDFSAYDPNYYNFKLPKDYPTPPSGRAADPMPGANGTYTPLNSLEPRNLALGQIIPFEVEITVKGSTSPESGVINFSCLWSTTTTSGSNFGFDQNYMVFAAFVDYSDPRSVDYGVPASASIVSSTMSGSNIKGDFRVSGLENNDKIIVEMWVVLKPQLPNNVSGNVQTTLDNAQTASGEKINTGSQTVPLNQTSKFTTEVADVDVIKRDNPDPLYTGDTLTYSIKVTNNSTTVVANGIVVTDTLDPKVTFISASDGGTLSGGVITWPVFALDTSTQKTLTVTVKVNSDSPTENFLGTNPALGSATGTRLPNVDISNIVRFTMITQDSNYNNNVWQEPTNILPRISVTAYKIWVGGPSIDHQPVSLTLYRHVGSNPSEVVTGVVPSISPPTGPSNRYTYVWSGLPTYNTSFQPYIYTVDEAVIPTNYTKTITANNTITNTYRPSLIISKVYGTTPLKDAIFELYGGDSNGPTGVSLGSITTSSDGKGIFANLLDGTYWLVETKPPKGYKWISNIGPFIVGSGTIVGPALYTPVQSEEVGTYTVSVQNEPIRELPATGGVGRTPFTIVGLGIIMLAIYLRKIDKSNSKDM